MMLPGSVAPEYFNLVQAGEYVGIIHPIRNDPDPHRTFDQQRQRIYQMVRRKTIPCHRVGKRLYFVRQELDAWIRGREKGWSS
jgi:excisionase family DNA binding protein